MCKTQPWATKCDQQIGATKSAPNKNNGSCFNTELLKINWGNNQK